MSSDGPPRNAVLAAQVSRPVARRTLKPRLSREHLLWAYRLFLDREPESEALLTSMLAEIETTEDLRQRFFSSEEFRQRTGCSLPAPSMTTWFAGPIASSSIGSPSRRDTWPTS